VEGEAEEECDARNELVVGLDKSAARTPAVSDKTSEKYL
jgi:hypothetical protein